MLFLEVRIQAVYVQCLTDTIIFYYNPYFVPEDLGIILIIVISLSMETLFYYSGIARRSNLLVLDFRGGFINTPSCPHIVSQCLQALQQIDLIIEYISTENQPGCQLY
jgi:hypothetical protein